MDMTSSTEHSAPATDADGYRFWHEDAVRFNDVDPLWHLNNNGFGILFETPRILFVRQASERASLEATSWMLVNSNLDYLAQVYFAEKVRIGTRVERFGRSSLIVMQAMFREDACVATLTSTMVLVDRVSEKSRPLPDDLKRALLDLSERGGNAG